MFTHPRELCVSCSVSLLVASVFLNDDNAISRKLRAVLLHNMKPILCVGESKSEYDAGLVKSVRERDGSRVVSVNETECFV